MFKNIGRSLRKLFTGKASKAESNNIIPIPVVSKKNDPGNTGRIGERTIKTPHELKLQREVLNKITIRRRRNKLARASRNAQHKIAA